MTDADKIQKLKAHETDLLEQRFKLETQQEEIESALKLVWMAPELGGSGDWGQDRPYMHKDEFCGEFKPKELA